MIPPQKEWNTFADGVDKEKHLRLWGLSLSAPMYFYDGYFSEGIVPCKLLGYQDDKTAIIQIEDELHCIRGEYLAEMQPKKKKADGWPKEYVVVDTETTSKFTAFAEIIEIAAIKYKNDIECGQFSTFVKPKRSIPASATKVNGITDADVADAPSWQDVEDDFFAFVGELPIVGHNVLYDIGVIQHQSMRWMPNTYIDTVQRAKQAFPGRKCYKLEALKEEVLQISEQSHRALEDCRTTYALYCACKNK